MMRGKRGAGAICGGVVSESEFIKDPMAYMMCIVLSDEDYAEYLRLIEAGNKSAALKVLKRGYRI